MFAGEAVSELWPPPPPSLLPDGLEEMAPGPELARVLAGIDVDSLPGFDLVVVMAAQARMVAYHQAGLLDVVARVADATTEASGLVADDDGEFAADEIRAALCLTRRAATFAAGTGPGAAKAPRSWPTRSAAGWSTSPGPGWSATRWPPWTTRKPNRWSPWCWSGLPLRPPVSWGRGCAAWSSPLNPPPPRNATRRGWRVGGWSCRLTPTGPPT